MLFLKLDRWVDRAVTKIKIKTKTKPHLTLKVVSQNMHLQIKDAEDYEGLPRDKGKLFGACNLDSSS